MHIFRKLLKAKSFRLVGGEGEYVLGVAIDSMYS